MKLWQWRCTENIEEVKNSSKLEKKEKCHSTHQVDLQDVNNEQGGQVIGPPLSVHPFENTRFRKSIISLWKCGDTLSCCNSMPSGPSFSKIDMKNSSNMSRYIVWVTVHSVKKNSPKHFLFGQSTNCVQFWTVSHMFGSWELLLPQIMRLY